MQHSYTIIFGLVLLALCLCQGAPVEQRIVKSDVDISGEPVRPKRASADKDSYICYPSSVVYSYHKAVGSRRNFDMKPSVYPTRRRYIYHADDY
ncbi:maker73 [Drosophila busckii]|uniref:Maker73 n=1 Tax=Drosophila busckii TaxID=30019 RepID=A0A0M3QUY4_DROBS|nr:uncharacterized protein LOC108596878 [Drosophila busckii]ALC41469.1 maker73 [Drosophila busckii]